MQLIFKCFSNSRIYYQLMLKINPSAYLPNRFDVDHVVLQTHEAEHIHS